MSAISKFELHFDKTDLIFRDGEYITGYMEVNLISEIKYKSIYFELRGLTTITWTNAGNVNSTENVNNNESDDNVDVIKEHCLEKHIILIKSGSFLDKDPSLAPGEHIFPFDLKIPCDLPYSFDGRYGKIKYDCIGVIEKSTSGFKMSERLVSSRQEVTIMAGLDLNLIPEASYNIEICKHKELGMCCSKGTITIDWLVDKSGFLPNDSIFIEGSIQNDSKQMVAHSSVSLIMVVDYKYKNRRLIDRVKIAHKDGSPVMADDVALWNDVIGVPQCSPSSLDRCKMIEVSYELEFKVWLTSSSLTQVSTTIAVNNTTYHNNNNPNQTMIYNKTIYIGTIPLTTYHHPRPTQSQYTPLPITYPLHTTALVAVQPMPMQQLQPTAILVPYYSNPMGITNGPILAPVHGSGVVVSSPNQSNDLMNLQNNYYGLYAAGNISPKYVNSSGNGSNNKSNNTDNTHQPPILETRPPPYAPGHVINLVQSSSSLSSSPSSSSSSSQPSTSLTQSAPLTPQPPSSSSILQTSSSLSSVLPSSSSPSSCLLSSSSPQTVITTIISPLHQSPTSLVSNSVQPTHSAYIQSNMYSISTPILMPTPSSSSSSSSSSFISSSATSAQTSSPPITSQPSSLSSPCKFQIQDDMNRLKDINDDGDDSNKESVGDNLKYSFQVIQLKDKKDQPGSPIDNESSGSDLISINSPTGDLQSTNDVASAPGLKTLLR